MSFSTAKILALAKAAAKEVAKETAEKKEAEELKQLLLPSSAEIYLDKQLLFHLYAWKLKHLSFSSISFMQLSSFLAGHYVMCADKRKEPMEIAAFIEAIVPKSTSIDAYLHLYSFLYLIYMNIPAEEQEELLEFLKERQQQNEQ